MFPNLGDLDILLKRINKEAKIFTVQIINREDGLVLVYSDGNGWGDLCVQMKSKELYMYMLAILKGILLGKGEEPAL